MDEKLNWGIVQRFTAGGSKAPSKRVVKTEEEWKQVLDAETYYVTRQHGTEHPFSSEMCGLFEPGIYGCACCETSLFNANQKYDSGSGWPSFSEPILDNVISYISDTKNGMNRVEVLCSTCDAHLGHVFPDGPKPTGLRFCINALSLKKHTSE